MVTDFGEQMHCQFLEILRILMDSFTMSGAHVSCVFCLNGFYKLYAVPTPQVSLNDCHLTWKKFIHELHSSCTLISTCQCCTFTSSKVV
jgi:hypothetical protein